MIQARVNSTSASESTLSLPASNKQSKQYIYKIYVKIQDICRRFEYLTTKKWRAQKITLFFEVPN